MASPRNNRPRADPLKNSLSTCLTVRENKHVLHIPACHEVLMRASTLQAVIEVDSQLARAHPTLAYFLPPSWHPRLYPTLMNTTSRAQEGPGTGKERARVMYPHNFSSFCLHHTEYLPAPKLSTQFLAGDKMINLVLTTIFQGEKACNSGKAFFPTKLWNMREIKESKCFIICKVL